MDRFSDTYVDRLLVSGKYDALVELQSIFWGWSGLAAHHSQYGLPPAAFTFVEVLNWFSQTIRSGAWTYFEATPTETQWAVLAELHRLAPPDFADQYKQGIEYWKDEEKMKVLDRWVAENESVCDQWLFDLLRQNSEELKVLYA